MCASLVQGQPAAVVGLVIQGHDDGALETFAAHRIPAGLARLCFRIAALDARSGLRDGRPLQPYYLQGRAEMQRSTEDDNCAVPGNRRRFLRLRARQRGTREPAQRT